MADLLPTLLDLDQTIEIPVKIGGRDFKLTQQRYPTLLRVIQFVNGAGVNAEGVDTDDYMDQNYQASIPLIALILGFEQDDTTKEETIAFLQAHLNPAKVLKIFETWWQLNEVDDFFDRAGRMLTHPDVAVAIREQRSRLLTQEIES